MSRETNARRRNAQSLASDLEREHRSVPRQQELLRNALQKDPALALETVLLPWLRFGELRTATEQLGSAYATASGAAVSNWMRQHDERLNTEVRDVRAPIEALPSYVKQALSPDAIALLSWPEFAVAMNDRDATTWQSALRTRVTLDLAIDGAQVPIDALILDPSLAAQIGPIAAVRAASHRLADPDQQLAALSEISTMWPALSTLSLTDLEPLAAVLESVDAATLIQADLHPALTVLGAWRTICEDPDGTWPRLDFESRVLAIYRAASEGINLDVSPLDDPHGLSMAMTLLFQASENDVGVVQEADRAISTVVIEHGWVNSDPPSLTVLLPGCKVAESGVNYCEGKLPAKSSDETAWCPRLRDWCGADRGSHVMPQPSLPWWRWSLLELLNSKSIPIRYRDSIWPNDLAGWLNRWYDVRERLRCTECGIIMEPLYQYSRSETAAYGKTVMNCPSGLTGHDLGVYLNHCNGCRQPIDSRECRERREGFYLCLRCGSGPEGLKPGDVCPECGSERTAKSNSSRWVTCQDCDHRVHTP